MLWNNLMCLDHFNIKTLSLEVWGSNPDNECLGFQTLTKFDTNKKYFLKFLNK